MTKRFVVAPAAPAALLFSLGLAGCVELDWYASQATGQAELLFSARPMEQVLRDSAQPDGLPAG